VAIPNSDIVSQKSTKQSVVGGNSQRKAFGRGKKKKESGEKLQNQNPTGYNIRWCVERAVNYYGITWPPREKSRKEKKNWNGTINLRLWTNGVKRKVTEYPARGRVAIYRISEQREKKRIAKKTKNRFSEKRGGSNKH